jgi:hypothetical protein
MRNGLLTASFAMVAAIVVWGMPEAAAQTAAPGNRDLSGIWGVREAAAPPWAKGERTQFATEVPLQQWAQEHCRKVGCGRGVNSAGLARGNAYVQGEDPSLIRCAPKGFPRMMINAGPMEIFQISNRVFMRFYFGNEMREIWTDGRKHPDDLDLTWRGHSVGQWDGDTLVVDTIGILGGEQGKFKWFDHAGNPHSDELHVVERIRRTSPDALQIDFRFEDPVTFTAPFNGKVIYMRNPRAEEGTVTRIAEYVQCEDRIFAEEATDAWPYVTGEYPTPQFPPAGTSR